MRIEQKFKQLKKQGRIAFMPFIVAGDPDFEASLEIVRILTTSADLLEIGFPYSDPLADGPTIQAADQRALKAGMNTDRAFELIKKIREFTKMPITVLVYANLVYQKGIGRFYQKAKEAGIDAVLIPDVPVEEIAPYMVAAKKTGIDQIFLVTQTTTSQRLKKILLYAQGYLYVVSVLGVTGERVSLSNKVPALVGYVRTHSTLPVAVGFGISKRTHVLALKKAHVDGYIVGSALIRIIEKNLGNRKKLKGELLKYVQSLTAHTSFI